MSRVVPCGHTVGGTDGQTDTKVIAVFHHFANAPKNVKVLKGDSNLNQGINVNIVLNKIESRTTECKQICKNVQIFQFPA